MGRILCNRAVLLSALALAWNGTAHVAWAAAEAAQEGGGGDILSPRFDLGIWTIIVFVVLLLVLRKLAWGPMLEGLQRREQNIRQALEDAQKARDEAQRVRTQLQGEMNNASEKIREMMEEARRDAQYVKDELVGKARAEIDGERDRLRREIETARDQAVQQVWAQAANLASMISSKAVRRQLSLDDHRRLVDEAITELAAAGNNRKSEVASMRS